MLAPSMLDFAQAHAGTNNIRAFQLFSCLARARAYQHEGFIRWRSKWLRGNVHLDRAIPGASTHGAWLNGIMQEHVLLKVKGAQWGRKAALFKPRFEIELGWLTRRCRPAARPQVNHLGKPSRRRQ